MSLKEILEDYISAQWKNDKTKHELKEAKTRLEMECRKIHNSSIVDGNLKMLATVLLGKLND